MDLHVSQISFNISNSCNLTLTYPDPFFLRNFFFSNSLSIKNNSIIVRHQLYFDGQNIDHNFGSFGFIFFEFSQKSNLWSIYRPQGMLGLRMKQGMLWLRTSCYLSFSYISLSLVHGVILLWYQPIIMIYSGKQTLVPMQLKQHMVILSKFESRTNRYFI